MPGNHPAASNLKIQLEGGEKRFLNTRSIAQQLLNAIGKGELIDSSSVRSSISRFRRFVTERQPISKELLIQAISELGSNLGVNGKVALELNIYRDPPHLSCLSVQRAHGLQLELAFSRTIVEEARRLIRAQSAEQPAWLVVTDLRTAIKATLGRKRWTPTCADFSELVVAQLQNTFVEECKGRPNSGLRICQ